jgi:ABC-type uncharacterized transport system YnjBCD ATPase subunit
VSRINIHNLTKTWGIVTGVDQVSFTVPEKSLTVLLGPSGCGKSTILRLIAGLKTVSSGTIRIGDKEITHEDPARRRVSMVFQSYALFPHLSVRENILFELKVRRVSKARQQKRLAEAARMVGLQDLLDRRPSQLSGGQRQRAALAIAMALFVNRAMPGRSLVRMAYFTPTILPMIAVANIWLFFYTPDIGLIDQILTAFGLSGRNWLGDPSTVLLAALALGQFFILDKRVHYR